MPGGAASIASSFLVEVAGGAGAIAGGAGRDAESLSPDASGAEVSSQARASSPQLAATNKNAARPKEPNALTPSGKRPLERVSDTMPQPSASTANPATPYHTFARNR